MIETGASSYTHVYDSDGKLARCSAAVDMLHHYGPPTYGVDFTGLGFCPHSEDPDDTDVVDIP